MYPQQTFKDKYLMLCMFHYIYMNIYRYVHDKPSMLRIVNAYTECRVQAFEQPANVSALFQIQEPTHNLLYVVYRHAFPINRCHLLRENHAETGELKEYLEGMQVSSN